VPAVKPAARSSLTLREISAMFALFSVVLDLVLSRLASNHNQTCLLG
jgi:hypothetical protein